MALLECPECGQSISSEATSCPHCGYPLRSEFVPEIRERSGCFETIAKIPCFIAGLFLIFIFALFVLGIFGAILSSPGTGVEVQRF